MPNKTAIQWGRLGAEGAAIVASILLAFAIDAWWESRQNRADEIAALDALKSDLNTFLIGLDWVDTHARGIHDSTRKLLVASFDGAKNLEESEIDVLLYDLAWSIDPAFVKVPALEEKAAGGAFSTVMGYEFRRKLGLFVTKLDSIHGDVLRDEKFFDEHLIPFLISNTFLPQVYTASNRTPGHPGNEFPTDDLDQQFERRSHKMLLADPTFQGLLQHRIIMLVDYLDVRPEGIREDALDLIAMIDEELAN
jgi:hypothetical protein